MKLLLPKHLLQVTTLFVLLFSVQMTFGQALITPTFSYSRQKPAYVYLKDGSQIEGIIKGLSRKKGQIATIEIEKNVNVRAYEANEIDHMYLPSSAINNISNQLNTIDNVQNINKPQSDPNFGKEGYVRLEQMEVNYGKKTYTLMLQLLNPHFEEVVKIYHDPMADETESLQVAGISIAGGVEASYFISFNGEAAYKINQKRYWSTYKELWGKCESMLYESYDKRWDNLGLHVFDYTNCQK